MFQTFRRLDDLARSRVCSGRGLDRGILVTGPTLSWCGLGTDERSADEELCRVEQVTWVSNERRRRLTEKCPVWWPTRQQVGGQPVGDRLSVSVRTTFCAISFHSPVSFSSLYEHRRARSGCWQTRRMRLGVSHDAHVSHVTVTHWERSATRRSPSASSDAERRDMVSDCLGDVGRPLALAALVLALAALAAVALGGALGLSDAIEVPVRLDADADVDAPTPADDDDADADAGWRSGMDALDVEIGGLFTVPIWADCFVDTRRVTAMSDGTRRRARWLSRGLWRCGNGSGCRPG